MILTEKLGHVNVAHCDLLPTRKCKLWDWLCLVCLSL